MSPENFLCSIIFAKNTFIVLNNFLRILSVIGCWSVKYIVISCLQKDYGFFSL
jgi:hypothetical protein